MPDRTEPVNPSKIPDKQDAPCHSSASRSIAQQCKPKRLAKPPKRSPLGWESRNIDLALVRRLCDTIGEGCELAVMPYESESEIAHWQRLGFILTTPERQKGYLHLSLGTKTPRIIAIDSDFGSYRVEDPQEDPDSD